MHLHDPCPQPGKNEPVQQEHHKQTKHKPGNKDNPDEPKRRR
ncbi:MAG: hypothetical protein WC620_03450 [Methanoregula sp.]